MTKEDERGFSIERAELFEAMSHPNRIRILKALSDRPLGFSELKRAVSMESSGLLSFHLDKLAHLVRADQSGMYVLTDEGREALQIIRSTTDGSGNSNGHVGSRKSYDRRKVITAVLVIGIIALGSVAVYQQSQLSALSRTISLQSSEMAHPSTNLVLSSFTVTKANATAEPKLFLVVRNNGTAPASSGSYLVMVYGKNNTIDSCYDGTGNFFPIFSNESTMIFAPLKCGDIGDTAALTVQVDFLTSSGSVTKAFTTKTTIGLSQVIQPSTVVVKQLGIKTWVQPQVFPAQTVYAWYLMITNEAQTPIDSVHATLSSGNNMLAEDSGCVIVTGNNLFSVSHTTPLTSTASCQVDSQTRPGTGPFSLGQQLEVVVSVTYINGTTSSASTTATVEPVYAVIH